MATTRRTSRRRAAAQDAAVAKRPTAGTRSIHRARPTARERALPAEQLITGVLDVKKALDETVAQFSAGICAQLGEVLRALEGHEPAAKAIVKEMLARVQEIRLKPEKGRVKDLVRLHDLAEDLVAMLPKH